MTRWIPVNDPPPPDALHTWARPVAEDCPNCVCCSKRLCELAVERDAANEIDGACHMLGTSPDFDLSECPCWRDAPGHIPVSADHPQRKVTPSRGDQS